MRNVCLLGIVWIMLCGFASAARAQDNTTPFSDAASLAPSKDAAVGDQSLERDGPCGVFTIAKGPASMWGLNFPHYTGSELIIRTPDAWAAFWRGHVGDPNAPVPQINFQHHVVVAVVQGPSPHAGGPNIAIANIAQHGPFVSIGVFDDRRQGDLGEPANPFHVVAIPRPCLPPHASVHFGHHAPLPGSGVLEGRVFVVAPDGTVHPFAGAHLRLLQQNGGPMFETMSGGDGSYFFVNIPPGNYGLVASAPGFEPVALPVAIPENGYVREDVFFEQPAPEPGAIVGLTLQPAAGALIPLPGTHVQLVRENEVVAQTVSNDAGQYGFPEVEPGAYVLRAVHEGFCPTLEPVAVLPGETVHRNLVLQPCAEPGAIVGHVGTPHAGAIIPVPDAHVVLRRDGQPVADTMTNEDGAYEFPHVAPGLYVIHVGHPEFCPATAEAEVHPGEVVVENFVLQPCNNEPGAVGGFVAFESENGLAPLPGSVLRLMRENGDVLETVSGDNGHYLFPEVAPGPYMLRAWHAGFLPQEVPIQVAPGQTVQQDFVLEPGPPPPHGALGGRVMGMRPDGEVVPLPEARVRVFISNHDVRQVFTNPEGFFFIGNLPPGTWLAVASKPGWQPSHTEVTIVAGEVTEVLFELSPASPPAGAAAPAAAAR